MEAKSLKSNAISNIIYKVLNVIFPLISTSYVSRVLLADGVGRISAVQNNVSYFLILATLGIPAYGLREIAKNRDDINCRSAMFSELIIVNFILTIAAYSIFNIIVFRNNYFENEKYLYEIFGLTILLNVFNIDWLFQGLEEYQYIAVRSIAIKLFSLLLLFVFVKNKTDIYIYAVIQVLGTTGNYFFNVIKFSNYVRLSFKNINISRHIKSLLYLALGSISTELYAKMDITMLDYLKSSAIVGCYANSQKIANLIITTLVAVTAVFLPRLSFLFEKDKKAYNSLLRMGFDLMVSISIPACVGLIIVSKPLVVSFLGEDFSNAATTLAILSFMIPLKCIGDLICYQVMMCAKQEKLLVKSYFMTMVVNLINNLLLIPRFGAEGAAIASVISELLAFVFVLFYSRTYFEFDSIKTVVLKTALCTVIMGGAVSIVARMPVNAYLKLILEGCVGVIVFIIACCVTKHETVLRYINIIKRKVMRD